MIIHNKDTRGGPVKLKGQGIMTSGFCVTLGTEMKLLKKKKKKKRKKKKRNTQSNWVNEL